MWLLRGVMSLDERITRIRGNAQLISPYTGRPIVSVMPSSSGELPYIHISEAYFIVIKRIGLSTKKLLLVK
jgi:hypothetical protein